MESIRQKQVAEIVKRNISILLQTEGRYIYGAQVLVTVTNVKMSPDLNLANIYLSVYNTNNKQEPLLQLNAEVRSLRQGLARRIRSHVRRIPEIQFFLDETLDELYKVDRLLNRLEEEGQLGEKPKDEENE